MEKCKRGDRCPRKHIMTAKNSIPEPGAPADAIDTCATATTESHQTTTPVTTAPTPANIERPIGPDNKRCIKDQRGEKCEFGTRCFYAHRDPINIRKDAAPRQMPTPHPDKRCNACGEEGHIAHQCKKLKEHAEEVKKAIGWTGEYDWFKDRSNSRKCILLFKQNLVWFAAAA